MALLELSEQLRWKTNMIANESQEAAHKNFIFHEHHFMLLPESAAITLKKTFGLCTAYIGYFYLFP